jgi:hypothetical protein
MATRFNFAWVDSDETSFGPEHQREDEEIVSAVVEHAEGEFAALTITVRNPRIGLLAPGRRTWAWFAYGATPLFFGRLVGVPSDMLQEIVTLVFTARPADYVAQKEALAESLRVLPYFDPVFISPDAIDDPDTVLEAYPLLWHIDRVTHEVTTSHILAGEDGVEVFNEDEVPRDSVRVTLDQVPTRRVLVDGSVTWDQAATGSLVIDEAARTTLTFGGKSLISEWPKPDKSLGGGWKAVDAFANDDLGIEETEVLSTSIQWTNPAKKHNVGDTMSMNLSVSRAPVRGDSVVLLVTSRSVSNTGEAGTDSTSIRVPEYQVTTGLTVGYDASRGRKEHVRFTLGANMQSVVTLPGEDEVLRLAVNGADVSIPLPDASSGDAVPIVDPGRRSYFTTDRGLRSLEYLISLARARLLMASRAVEIEWDCRFERALALSCRKNATLNDPRLPSGSATGKVKRYRINCDGDSGAIIGAVTIGCAVGYGGAIETVPGDPLYVDEGYVALGYQAYSGQVNVFDTGDVGYTVPVDAPVDDGLTFPLRKDDVVINAEWIGTNAAQRAAITAAGVIPDTRYNPPLLSNMVADIFDAAKEIPKRVQDALVTAPIYFDLQLRGLEGNFETAYDINLTTLQIPQGINLEGGVDLIMGDGTGNEYLTWQDGDDAALLWD